jgi:hypothetical protein
VASRIAPKIGFEIDGEVWRRVESLEGSSPDDAHYVLAMKNDGSATLTFGDGKQGRRLPAVVTTHRPSKRFIAILMQQGRVILDTDWNEAGTASRSLYGIYAGSVTDNLDPLSRLRVKVSVPAAGGLEMWARPCVPVAESGVPSVGQSVWIAFEGGDPASPVWLGVIPE